MTPREQDPRLLHELTGRSDRAGEAARRVEVGEASRKVEPVATRGRIGQVVGVVDRPAGKDVRACHEAHRGTPPEEHHLEGTWIGLADHDDRGRTTGSHGCRHTGKHALSNYRPFCNRTPTC